MLFGNLCTSVLANSKDYLQTKIYFPFGNSSINNQFRENNMKIQLIDSVCSSLDKSGHYQIQIIGSASPEGELSFNKNLSRERAEALKNQLVTKYNFPDTIFAIESLGANKESVESPRDLRYAEIAINTIEVAKAAPVIKKTATNIPVHVKASFWDKLNWLLWVLLALIIIGLIIVAIKKNGIPHLGLGSHSTNGTNSFESNDFSSSNIKSGTPSGNTGGLNWEGERGNSNLLFDNDFVPGNDDNNCNHYKWKQLKTKYNFDKIPFINGDPQFEVITQEWNDIECKVKIDDFTEARYSRDRNDGKLGNFEQADIKLAEKLGSAWTAKKIFERRNKEYLTWHEEENGVMRLVPKLVHDNISHQGGVSSYKRNNQS